MISGRRSSFFFAALSAFIFSIHLASTSYGNSTFAENFVDSGSVGTLYSIAALITLIILLFYSSKLIAKFGSALFLGVLFSINVLTLFTLAGSTTPLITLISFIIYLSTNTLILYGHDITIEHTTINKNTGSTRGRYLTTLNLAWMFSPLLAGVVIERGGFSLLYTLSALLVLISFAIFTFKAHELDKLKTKKIHLWVVLKKIIKDRNLFAIASVSFILQFFYAWMVIYTPLFLHTTIGFSWGEIGIIFLIMLSAFVILQYPLGKLADTKFGEKELLIAGLLSMGIATLMLPTITEKSILIWGIALFATRIGAATTEVMSDSYFFKLINDSDTGFISFYRSMAPFAYIIAPLIGGVIVASFGFNTLFSVLGIIVLCATIPAVTIHDTN
jgi:MFS family permease